jgi:hypothetical protein
MELVRAEPDGDLSCLVSVMQENPATLSRVPPYRIA